MIPIPVISVQMMRMDLLEGNAQRFHVPWLKGDISRLSVQDPLLWNLAPLPCPRPQTVPVAPGHCIPLGRPLASRPHLIGPGVGVRPSWAEPLPQKPTWDQEREKPGPDRLSG